MKTKQWLSALNILRAIDCNPDVSAFTNHPTSWDLDDGYRQIILSRGVYNELKELLQELVGDSQQVLDDEDVEKMRV